MSSRAGLAVAVAGVTAFAALAAFGVLQQDFVAYWVAGSVRRLGLDPYVNHAVPGVAPTLWDGSIFRHSRFLYPPLAADLFRPVAALPYRAAKVVFTGLLIAAWIATAALVGRGRRAPAVLVAGALFFPLYLNLERGQIDLLLLLLMAAAWTARDRAPLAGGLFALAAVFKPALLGVLPVLAALRRWRWLGAVLGWCAVFGVVMLAVSGPSLVREYGATVLPRALLYGEGGSDEMAYHERDLERVFDGNHDDKQSVDGRAYHYAFPFFDRPVSASLPRLLAPQSPSWPTSLLPYLIGIAGLAWAARRGRVLVAGGSERELMLLAAALVACVVTSPAGWAMGFVWALPMVPVALPLLRDVRLSRPLRWGLGGAWIACALPPPVAGWSAVAGTALVVIAAAAAHRWPEPA